MILLRAFTEDLITYELNRLEGVTMAVQSDASSLMDPGGALIEGTPTLKPGLEIRCYDCSSKEILGVCCFCGRFLCRKCRKSAHVFIRQIGSCAVPLSVQRRGSNYCNEHVPRALSLGGVLAVF